MMPPNEINFTLKFIFLNKLQSSQTHVLRKETVYLAISIASGSDQIEFQAGIFELCPN